jgi:hypothetical protein
MVDPTPFDKFVKQHGGPPSLEDENLMIEYEDGKIKVYYASVYGSDFVKVPKGFFTSQTIYRNFCVDVAKRLPAKRAGIDFDRYVNQALDQATLLETPPGMEEGAVVRHAIFSTLWNYRTTWHPSGGKRENAERYCDYDNPERVKRSVEKGDPAFIETRPEGPGYPEMFIRINALMDHMTFLQSQGQFERKILREEVVYELKKISRQPYPATGVSPRRLRSTYPIPCSIYEEWKTDDSAADEREELGYQNR